MDIQSYWGPSDGFLYHSCIIGINFMCHSPQGCHLAAIAQRVSWAGELDPSIPWVVNTMGWSQGPWAPSHERYLDFQFFREKGLVWILKFFCFSSSQTNTGSLGSRYLRYWYLLLNSFGQLFDTVPITHLHTYCICRYLPVGRYPSLR